MTLLQRLAFAGAIGAMGCKVGYVGTQPQVPVAVTIAGPNGAKAFTMNIGESMILRATMTAENGTYWIEDAVLVSRDPSIVAISEVSRITAVKAGTAYIVASNHSLFDSVLVTARSASATRR